MLVLLLFVTGCATRSIAPKAPGDPVRTRILEVREGLASYYGPGFHGRTTASGTRFDMNAMVAAHPTYPFGTIVRVINLSNGKTVRLRIVDRGPAAEPRAAGVVIDLSYGAARALDFVRSGRTQVRVEVLRWGAN